MAEGKDTHDGPQIKLKQSLSKSAMKLLLGYIWFPPNRYVIMHKSSVLACFDSIFTDSLCNVRKSSAVSRIMISLDELVTHVLRRQSLSHKIIDSWWSSIDIVPITTSCRPREPFASTGKLKRNLCSQALAAASASRSRRSRLLYRVGRN
jgi:hypothetical protein